MTPEFVFTLIHGTFSPHAPWTRPSSPLCKLLKARYPGCVITAPVWSGLNTHAGRLKASSDIGKVLLFQHLKHPHAKHFVIAHSHGGTIALHACENRAVARTLSGVITLGTPYIHSRRRNLTPAIRLLREMVTLGRTLVMLWSWAAAIFIVGLPLLILDLVSEGREVPPLVRQAVLATCLAAFIAVVVYTVRQRLTKSPLLGAFAHPVRWVRTRQRQVHAAMREPYRHVRGLNLLAVCVDRDEAQLFLRVLGVMGGAAHFVHDVVSFCLRPAVYVSVLVGIAVLIDRLIRFYDKTPYLFDFLTRSAFGMSKFLLAGFIWIAGLSLLIHALMIAWPVVRLHRFGYGEGSFWPNWLLEIQARKSPGFAPRWALLKAKGHLRFGRHSHLCNDPAVLGAVADWIDSPGPLGLDVEPDRSTRRRAPKGLLVRAVSSGLLLALAIWLWMDPIQVYHIHS